MKHPTLSRATDALIGEEEQNRKQNEKEERNKERVPSPATLDHLVTSYDAQGSYCERIPFNPPPRFTGGRK